VNRRAVFAFRRFDERHNQRRSRLIEHDFAEIRRPRLQACKRRRRRLDEFDECVQGGFAWRFGQQIGGRIAELVEPDTVGSAALPSPQKTGGAESVISWQNGPVTGGNHDNQKRSGFDRGIRPRGSSAARLRHRPNRDGPSPGFDFNWVASAGNMSATVMHRYDSALLELKRQNRRVDWEGVTDRDSEGDARRIARYLSEVE
jgi:hypothetical protein